VDIEIKAIEIVDIEIQTGPKKDVQKVSAFIRVYWGVAYSVA
jgi:hypothetical protein